MTGRTTPRPPAPGLLVALALPLLALPLRAAAPFSLVEERAVYRTHQLEDGSPAGSSVITIHNQNGKVELVEDRTLKDGGRDLYRLELKPGNLTPLRWERELSGSKGHYRARLYFEPKRLRVELTGADGTRRQDSLERPAGEVTVAPLMKFHLAERIARKRIPGTFHMVVFDGEDLDAYEIEVEDLGITTLTTAAGSFRCHHLRVGPSSTVISALVPPGDMYFAVEGSHPLVRGDGKVTRLMPVMRTELVQYSAR